MEQIIRDLTYAKERKIFVNNFEVPIWLEVQRTDKEISRMRPLYFIAITPLFKAFGFVGYRKKTAKQLSQRIARNIRLTKTNKRNNIYTANIETLGGIFNYFKNNHSEASQNFNVQDVQDFKVKIRNTLREGLSDRQLLRHAFGNNDEISPVQVAFQISEDTACDFLGLPYKIFREKTERYSIKDKWIEEEDTFVFQATDIIKLRELLEIENAQYFTCGLLESEAGGKPYSFETYSDQTADELLEENIRIIKRKQKGKAVNY